MKKLTSIICFTCINFAALAQGLVNFLNGPTTLISTSPPPAPMPAEADTFYFALLTAPVGTTDPHQFTFSGILGTNVGAPGRLTGGVVVPVAGWLPGTQRAFEVVGWSADNGPAFNPAWMGPGPINGFAGTPTGYFGVSAISPSGVAGGGEEPFPSLGIFAGVEGVQGFILLSVSSVPPTITISRSGTQAILSWPESATGFTLEYSDTLPAVSWAPVSGVTGNTVTVDTSVGSRFYRLRR